MKKTFINYCGIFGILSFISYTLAVIVSPVAYPGYDWMRQAVSDLSASTAPSLALWNQLSSVYNVCEVLCSLSVLIWISTKENKLIKLGVFLFFLMELISAVGYKMFPLSDAGYNGTPQDVMHMVTTLIVVLLSIASLIIIIIAGLKDKNYLSISICAIVALSLMMIGALGIKIVSQKYFGIVERFSVFSVTGFNLTLGIHLLINKNKESTSN